MPAMKAYELVTWFRRGFRTKWQTVLLIAGINTAIAALISIEDPRPFWHPLVSAHCFGFSIAYFINCFRPWDRVDSMRRLLLAVVLGSLVGMALVIVVKQYEMARIAAEYHRFLLTMGNACLFGFLVSVFFHTRLRDAAAAAALHRAQSERERLGRQVAEAQLKLMQAQVEPHFLFNTLANVHFLVETDPPRAATLLDHLLQYLRAAIPQLRQQSTTLGQEARLTQAYLSIIQMRMGSRLRFSVAIPEELEGVPFPPMVLLSLVENAVKHGIEPNSNGGEVVVGARRLDGRLAVWVEDNGKGLGESFAQGVGLSNIRERLAALYGGLARFSLTQGPQGGAVARVEIPDEPDARPAR